MLIQQPHSRIFAMCGYRCSQNGFFLLHCVTSSSAMWFLQSATRLMILRYILPQKRTVNNWRLFNIFLLLQSYMIQAKTTLVMVISDGWMTGANFCFLGQKCTWICVSDTVQHFMITEETTSVILSQRFWANNLVQHESLLWFPWKIVFEVCTK